MAVPSPAGGQLHNIGQQRSSGAGTPQRQTSGTPTPSNMAQSDPWQQHNTSYNPQNPSPISRPSQPEMGQPNSLWRAESNGSDRSPPVMQPNMPSGVNYGYMMDNAGRTMPYRGDPSLSSYSASSLSSEYNQRLGPNAQDFKPSQTINSAPGYQRPQQTPPEYSAPSRSSSHLSDYNPGVQSAEYGRAPAATSTDYPSRGPLQNSGYQGRDIAAQTGAVGAYCPMPTPQPYMATAPAAQQSAVTTYPVQQSVSAMHAQQAGPMRYYDPNVG
jgi:hypothetical protein